MFEELIAWYVEDRTKWVNKFYLSDYYRGHISEDPNSVVSSIRNTMEYNLRIGINNGEIKQEDVNILLSNSSLVKEFVEAVFNGLKQNFPLVEKK